MKTKTNKLKNRLVIAGLSFLFCYTINAQDLITFKNGDVAIVKVIEINETEIKYKKMDNLEGPIRVIPKGELFSIKYENGTKTVFEKEPDQVITVNKVPVNQPAHNNKFETDSSDFAKTKQKRFGGPRIGVTYISPGTTSDYLASEGKQPLITQFGWQFEGRLFTVDGNTQGMIEFIPMIGGIEQGLFIPSASFMIGIRYGEKRTYEFGIGPNFSVTKDYKRETAGAMGVVLAFGTSFKSGNINFPVNIAFVPSVGSKHYEWDYAANRAAEPMHLIKYSTGWRLSLVVGFNSRKK